LILFENQIQTTSALPCRTQVQPAASFLVCSLIFIEYEPILSQKMRENYKNETQKFCRISRKQVKKQPPVQLLFVFLIS